MSSNIIRPLSGGTFGALKAEESKIKLINAMNTAGPQLPEALNVRVHHGVERVLLEAVLPGGGQIKLEVMLAATIVGFASVCATYLDQVAVGPLASIPQTDGFMEAIVDVFRVQMNNAVVDKRIKKISNRPVGLPS